MHALYRRRSVLDNQLINDVVELSLSPYTRVRRCVRFLFAFAIFIIHFHRHAQAIFQNVCNVSQFGHRSKPHIEINLIALCEIYKTSASGSIGSSCEGHRSRPNERSSLRPVE